MVVVADTSPLNYLILIGQFELLQQLYGQVLAPQAVIFEMLHPQAPSPVRALAANPPAWLVVVPVESSACEANAALMPDLDWGEIAAITLASTGTAERSETLLLMDETAGRAQAARWGIPSTGTLGILRDAALTGLIDLPEAIKQLRGTSFRMPESVVATLLQQDAARVQQQKSPPE